MTYSLTYLVKEFLDERYPTHEKKVETCKKAFRSNLTDVLNRGFREALEELMQKKTAQY